MNERETGWIRLTPHQIAKLLGVLVVGGAVVAASCASVPKGGEGSAGSAGSSSDGGQGQAQGQGSSSGTGILGW
jgi:hypothetical protein